jgi:hypothetical protein
MSDEKHVIGLLLGAEEDRPRAFETIVRRLGPVTASGGTHGYEVERITIEPFDLRMRQRYDLVIDRLAYWYYHPREWLKKVAMMDDASGGACSRSPRAAGRGSTSTPDAPSRSPIAPTCPTPTSSRPTAGCR